MAKRIAAVIGHPIAHSLSPALFAEFTRASGIDLDYRAVDVPPDALGATLAGWREDARFVGCNVTMPHKERIIPLLDDCSDAARACSAVNVVRRNGSGLVGENTDVAGIAASLNVRGFSAHGASAVVFGAGGGAHAVIEVLGEHGATEVWIVARTSARGRLLSQNAAMRWPQTAFTVLSFDEEMPPPADLYVNATPLGQTGQQWRTMLPSNAPAGALAFDLVYRPANTPFLAEAAARGLRTIGGFTMLLEQALATYEAWFASRPPLDEAARKRLESLAA
ncbi:MAG: shikimate dehydrogenase family protein [Vulcanimicrobiaceae bacterium]